MMSARVSAADFTVGLNVGADDYIGKPCLIKEVIDRIHAILSNKDPLECSTSTESESD